MTVQTTGSLLRAEQYRRTALPRGGQSSSTNWRLIGCVGGCDLVSPEPTILPRRMRFACTEAEGRRSL
jgi:hypothetical protein